MIGKIEEIRKRHEDVAWRYIELPVIYEDRAFLLDEVERHRAENERLRAEMRDLAEWAEMEVPLSHDYVAYRLRKALEAKP